MDGPLAEHPWVARHTLDVHACHRMAEAGILGPEDRVELIEVELVTTAPITPLHAGHANRLNRLAILGTGRDVVVSARNPVRLDRHNEPQPDLALLRGRPDGHAAAHPSPADVLLLVELSDASLRYDREVKARLYARHRVPEYWIVDVAGGALERHRDPAPDSYRLVDRFGRGGGTVAPAALPGLVLRLDEVLG